MNEKEEFPFQYLIQMLSDGSDLKKGLKNIIGEIKDKNIQWIYSVLSTIIQIMKSKNQQPEVKCRCLQASLIILSTFQYPVVTIFEVYFLPLLQEIALYGVKKSQSQLAYYFQQIWFIQDSPKLKKHSIEYVERATQLIDLCYKIKPYRTIQNEQLKQPSLFFDVRSSLSSKGIEVKNFKWTPQQMIRDCRKQFLQRLKRFSQQNQPWMQFLLVNLIEEIKTSRKQLLQLRLLLAYGQSYITSSMINFCEDQLVDLSEQFQHKRKFLGVINELIRFGDIQAIIMVKNSEFLPAICSEISKLAGHLGVNEGEKLFPQIQASKKDKKQFYCDLLRCLQNWAISMPSDFDSEDFNLKAIYKYLKQQKKFKFPDNLHLSRYEKEVKQNMIKNKQRNLKLIEILQNLNQSRQVSISLRQNPKQTLSQHTTANIHVKLQQIDKQLNNLLLGQQYVQSSMKCLISFKDNWIIFLQEIDIQKIDQNQLQLFINQGQKYVQKIQLIIPAQISYRKGKITYKQFKNKVSQSTNFHLQVSQHMISQNNISKSNLKHEISNVKSTINNSKRNKVLRQKMRSKSRLSGISNKLNRSKALDRSQLSKSIDKSRLDKSKFNNNDISRSINLVQFTDVVKVTERKSSFKHQNSNLTIKQTNSIKKQQSNLPFKKSQNNSKHQAILSDIIHDKQIDLPPPIINQKVSLKKSSQKSQHYKLKAYNSKVSQQYEKNGSVKQYKQSIVKRISDYDPPQNNNEDQKSEVSKINQSNSSSKISNKNRLARLDRSKDSRRSNKSITKFFEAKNQRKHNEIKMQYGQQVKQRTQSYYLRQNKQQNDVRSRQSDILKNKLQDKNIAKQRQDNDFNDYNSISSIHSTQEKKVFQNSVQQVLNITKKQSQITKKQSQINKKQNQINKKQSQIVKKQSHIIKIKNGESGFSKEKIKTDRQLQQDDSYEYKKQSSSQDIIDTPDIKPLKNSFHSKQSNLDDYRKKQQIPLFKDVFKNNNSVYYRQKQQKLLRKDSGIKNIVKSAKSLSSNKKQSIVNKLFTFEQKGSFQNIGSRQRSSRQYDENYYTTSTKGFKNIEYQSLVQSQKDKQINLLRERIKQLEKDSMFMRTKLAAKDNQIQSMKNISLNSSERNFQFTSNNASNFAKTQNKSQKSSLRGSSVSRLVSMTPFQKQIQSNFKQYLQKIKGTSFKKSLLKLKCLIHKTDEIQIGCLSQRGDRLLQSTVFITPQHFDFVDITLTMQHDNNLKIKLHPTTIKRVQAKKQHKINLTIEVKNIPFSLPQLQITYKSSTEYSSTYYRMTLPLSFNKYCQISPINIQQISQRHILFIRTDDFKMNMKVSKLQKIHQCFANFTVIPPKKQRSCWLIIGKCRFQNSIFNICLSLSEKNSWIEGFLIDGQPTQMNFWICTMKQILDVKTK